MDDNTEFEPLPEELDAGSEVVEDERSVEPEEVWDGSPEPENPETD